MPTPGTKPARSRRLMITYAYAGPMCEKCKRIDDRIARYQLLRSRISDQQTLDGVARLIKELEAQKENLHRE